MSTAELRARLRWLADTYERVQAIRIAAGERLRAVIDGRAAAARDPAQPSATNAATILVRIRKGECDGPEPVLGRTYRVHHAEEQRLRTAMAAALDSHPAWSWFQQVRGIGPTLAAKLLARLDLSRASTPSSFWAYCGLATVPAPDGTRRIAPRGRRGDHPIHDRYARRVCYQIGCALLRADGSYARYYRRERGRIEKSRPGWNCGHCHMAALRKMEKLLLAHLWVVWAEQTGVPLTLPYACTLPAARTRYITPHSMIELSACRTEP